MRYKDWIIQRLKEAVLNANPSVWWNPGGPDETTCPFCYNHVNNTNGIMDEIPHSENCPYLFAKTIKIEEDDDI